MLRYRLLLLVIVFGIAGADWPQFRGVGSSSLAPEAKLPTTWDGAEGKNIAWRVDLPGRGVAGAIVVDGRVIVTASSGAEQDRLHVLCFDAATGKARWNRQFWATGRTFCHPTSAVAANTPATDGKLIFAFFSSNDLACLDLDGNLQWYRGLTYDYPNAANDVGMSASPVVTDRAVIVQVESKGDSFAAALDKNSGETLWRVERPAIMNWASPALLAGANGQQIVLLQSTTGLTAHDAATGQQIWAHEKKCDGIPSPLATENLVFVPSDGLTALKGATGGSQAEVLWATNKLDPGNASPVVYRGDVYVINSAGALTCGDVHSGEVKWRTRLKGPYWATPVIADGRLYATNQDGVTHVVALGEKGEIVAENPLGSEVFGSPAVADGAIYLRSVDKLWKIAER